MGVLALGAALALTGCASSTGSVATGSPTPTAEESANAEACAAFADATSTIADAFGDSTSNANDAWEEVRIAFDKAGLAAEGAVQQRISTLVDHWPSAGDIFVRSEAREKMNSSIRDIGRACEADDAKVTYYTFATD